MERKQLSEETLLKLGRAAIRNVYAYEEDIEALLEDSRHVRAFALQVMAVEELAKAFWVQMVRTTDDHDAWAHLWEALGGRGVHQKRLSVILALEEMVSQAGGASDLMNLMRGLGAGDLFEVRNAALYVDVRDDEVLSPDLFLPPVRLEGLRQALAKAMVVVTIYVDGTLEECTRGR